MMPGMGDVVDLQGRRVYSFRQIDDILGLRAGTSSRWIDGYERGQKFYEPVIRPEHTGDTVATWGEFIECRLLSEYRTAGVSIQRMRPAVERLREMTNSRYPLASARLWIAPEGRELVAQVQEDVKLDHALALVVIRSGQTVLDWSDRAESFRHAVVWSSESADAEPVLVRPNPQIPQVIVDPQRGYGDPVIEGRNVPTSVLRELFDAGESIGQVADAYELTTAQVEAAVRFERWSQTRTA